MNLNSRQKLILEKLLHKYESSKTYKGENSVRQTFFILPTDVYPKYNDDFEDVNAEKPWHGNEELWDKIIPEIKVKNKFE
jgi:hypothetical protein